MSDRLAAATATLQRLGLDPGVLAGETLPPGAAEGFVAPTAGPDGAALAEALAEFPTRATAALLATLETQARDRETRRAIRKALYRLAQRGITPPEVAAPAAPARAPGVEPEAFLSAVVRDGDRIAWLARPLTDGGTLVVYAYFHEQRGLLDISAGEVGRKRARELRQQTAAETRLRMVATDWRVVDALLLEAQERAPSDDPARDYRKIRARLTSAVPAPPAEPRSSRVGAAPAADAPARLAASATLLTEPEIATWWPTPDAMQPFLQELAGARESPLLLSKAAQEDRVREVLRRAARTLVPPAVLARRLEGTAYVLAETGRVEPACTALAVAAALRADGADPADIPFVAGLTERALGQLLAAETARQQESERGSLVVTPAQALRDRSSSRPGHTRG